MSFLSPVHIVFFAAIALLALGPKRFPELTRTLGNTIRELREVLSGVPGRGDLTSADAEPDGSAPVAASAPVATSAPVSAPAIAPVAGQAPPSGAAAQAPAG